MFVAFDNVHLLIHSELDENNKYKLVHNTKKIEPNYVIEGETVYFNAAQIYVATEHGMIPTGSKNVVMPPTKKVSKTWPELDWILTKCHIELESIESYIVNCDGKVIGFAYEDGLIYYFKPLANDAERFNPTMTSLGSYPQYLDGLQLENYLSLISGDRLVRKFLTDKDVARVIIYNNR